MTAQTINHPVTHHDAGIGLGATLVAVSVPDTWLPYGERFLFAIFTAIVSTLVSAAMARYLAKKANKS